MPDTLENKADELSVDAILTAIDEDVRPYVESHGGRIEFVHFVMGSVGIRLSGACRGCSALNITLKFGIERMLRRRFREVDKVELLTD